VVCPIVVFPIAICPIAVCPIAVCPIVVCPIAVCPIAIGLTAIKRLNTNHILGPILTSFEKFTLHFKEFDVKVTVAHFLL
jgi:hypothetical protein